MLQIVKTQKVFHQQPVFQVPNLQLEKGIYWLKGVNGSGKTTLLRMLAGLSPFEGQIALQGISLRQQPLKYRRLVSLAEAEPTYPAFVTGRELISFYRSVRRSAVGQIEELIGIFGVRSYIQHPIGSYSSGMTKRLSLLLAFIGAVPLILLDEPLATLDGEAASFLPGLIREYRQQHDVSFIFTSHQRLSADGFPIDATLVIADGTIHPDA